MQTAVDGSERTTDALRAKIDSVTAEMNLASEDGDWQQALDLGNLRRDLLEALFQAVRDPNEEVELIERILESDRLLAEQARVARGLVADELAGRREKRRAVGAYREAASRDI
jgi:hypothetical protein